MDNRTIIGQLSTIGLALCFQASPALAQITVNTAEGLREALIAAGGPTTIVMQPGRYDLWPEDGHKEWVFVSNTSSEEETADKTKVFGIWIDGLKDITIKGYGARVVCHGDMTPIGINESRNITLEGLEVDFERPGMSEFTCISSVPGKTVCRFHKDSRYVIEDGTLELVGEGWITETPHCVRYFPAEGRLYYSEDWDVFHDSKAVEIEPGLVCFETPEDFKAVPGDVLTVRDRIRRQTGSLIQYSENILLEGMKYRFMHGLGVVSQFTRNISIVDCVFTPSEDSGRVIASSADFAHFSGCAGLVEVRGCRFCGAHDDPINVHGTNLRAVRKVSDRTVVVRFCHGQTYGLKAFRPGDKVCFERAETLERYSESTVLDAERLDDYEIRLTLDRNLPDGLRLGSNCVENLTWTPEVIISGNEFSRTSTRGILLTTPRKAVIENNVFRHVGMNGILIAGDAADWFESGPVCDVTIRGNRFEGCTFNGGPDNAYISIHPSNTVVDKAIPVHRNIRIEGNTFVLRDGCPALSAKSVCGLQEEISALLKDFPGEAGVAVAVGKDRINRQKSASD